MNQHLKKIAVATDVYCDQHYFNDPNYDLLWEEKFAELIVKECVKVAKATPCAIEDNMISKNVYGHTWDMACIYAGKEIEKHFGVEE